MELWIRSQDKEKLCKVHDLCVRENQNENNETNYVIQDIYTMGTYKTKERALEVLDEIQEILKPKMVYKNITKDTTGIENIIQCFKNNVHFNTNNNADIHFINNTYVYEMPKE